jgi:hypothetical protein
MIDLLKIIISIIITPFLIIIGLGVSIYVIHETIWNNKKWKDDLK